MLDDFAVAVETEDVDPGVVLVVRPGLVAVEHDVVVLGHGPLDLDPFAWVFRRHALEVVDERLLAVADVWIVLDVDVADVSLDRLGGLALVV